MPATPPRPPDLRRPDTGLPGDRILLALKTRGPLSTAELGRTLGVTGEAARQQLVRLEPEGLVEGRREAGGVGRPRQSWWLTADCVRLSRRDACVTPPSRAIAVTSRRWRTSRFIVP